MKPSLIHKGLRKFFGERDSGMEKMKIMLVDDEERFLLTTGKLLTKKGFDVLTASRGEQCLEMLADNLVHVVILDVKMPGMNGLETLQEIKREHPLIEVIMLTGHATVESAVEGLRSGAIDYLMKPVSVDDLIAKAEAAFARRQVIEDKIRSAQTRKSMDQTSDDALNEVGKKE